MVRDLKFSLCYFCLFLKNHGIYSFECSATSLADFRESSVMFCKSLNIPSQSLSTEVVLVDGIQCWPTNATPPLIGRAPDWATYWNHRPEVNYSRSALYVKSNYCLSPYDTWFYFSIFCDLKKKIRNRFREIRPSPEIANLGPQKNKILRYFFVQRVTQYFMTEILKYS